jgi:hypothetical protein
MRDEAIQDDPLIRAIAELRSEVDRLIDAEIARLGAVAARPAIATNGRHVEPAPEPEPIEPSRPAPDGDASDPGLRLDALAQRLEGRLRRARERTNGRPDPDEA